MLDPDGLVKLWFWIGCDRAYFPSGLVMVGVWHDFFVHAVCVSMFWLPVPDMREIVGNGRFSD